MEMQNSFKFHRTSNPGAPNMLHASMF